MKKKLKKGFLVLSVLILIFIAFNFSLIKYGWGQLMGQIEVLKNAEPIVEILKKEDFPDSLKVKLKLIQEVKKYAEDSLGITKSNNYTSVYDQKGKPILWVITASDKYQLIDYQWEFPVLGEVSYKGFFELEKAQKEAKILEEKGFDTSIREVSAWSTLGWFDDPILTNFLDRTEGDLANLIIHELTHGTLYIKDDVTYNENLANFIGHIGAKKFLNHKYGKGSIEYNKYISEQKDDALLTEFVLQKADSLDQLYIYWKELTNPEKELTKNNALNSIFKEMETLPFQVLQIPKREELPNNTYFLAFRRYNVDFSSFEKEFIEQFDGNFHQYFASLKKKYGK